MKPLIGVPCCAVATPNLPDHRVGEKYITAVTSFGGLPVLIPALGSAMDLAALLDRLDGVLLTGSPSNVEPHHYRGEASRAGTAHDPARDATTLPLIRQAVDRGLPVFGICRGFQELNVALGGTLFQNVHEEPGRIDHRSRKDVDFNAKYKIAHAVNVTPGSQLARWTNQQRIMVNSLHAQAIDKPAPGLAIEAVADDGTIEAVSYSGRGFVYAVQWHPEWPDPKAPISAALFNAFADAVRSRPR